MLVILRSPTGDEESPVPALRFFASLRMTNEGLRDG
jgi:hypothetical protein